jgi:DNA/RNA-binding domain of Phe-tRNA-synthetase-like protein
MLLEDMPALALDPHPLLDIGAFLSVFPKPLGETLSPDWLTALLKHDAQAPLQRDESTRAAVRDLLRHGGYKPTGRGKPSSEYLVAASTEGRLCPINAAVDACNAASLHSGLPITVLDLDLAQQPWRVGLAPQGAKYVFNPAGQEIDLAGLLCVFDSQGPCGNGVKDSQRTKTHERTTRTLSIVWGTRSCPGRTRRAVDWYRSLVDRLGARTEELL